MIDPALGSLGAQIVLAASSDENHPPENIIDGWDGFIYLLFLKYNLLPLCLSSMLLDS